VSTATKIEWTEVTWNPTTGCDRISPGCDHCYALTLAKRLKAMGQAKYQHDGDPRTSGPGVSVSYERLGDLARHAGDNAEATRRYQQDLAIAEQLTRLDPCQHAIPARPDDLLRAARRPGNCQCG
jgi:hypothetical protein